MRFWENRSAIMRRSKSIDNSSDYSPGQATNDHGFAQDQFNLANERAVSAYNIPRRFTLSHVWQVRFSERRREFWAMPWAAWTFSSIDQMQSGIPFTVLTGRGWASRTSTWMETWSAAWIMRAGKLRRRRCLSSRPGGHAIELRVHASRFWETMELADATLDG